MLTADTVLQNRYRIIQPIGQGGMGAVYLAIDNRLGHEVALKETFHSDSETLTKAFEREARLLARLRHPALPRVSDHFAEDGRQFLVMEYVAGDDLFALLAKNGKPFDHQRVMRWGDELLDALEYLHRYDPPIIHRDIKPQNLKLTDGDHIILLDFGLAKGTGGELSRVTTSHSIYGYTPNYAPLEQIKGTGTEPRSDLYALAATLYHLMTGVAPPDALTRVEAIVERRADPLRRADAVSVIVTPQIALALQRAMSLNREERFASAAEMRRSLSEAAEGRYADTSNAAQTLITSPYDSAMLTAPTKIINREGMTTEARSEPETTALLTEATGIKSEEETVVSRDEEATASQTTSPSGLTQTTRIATGGETHEHTRPETLSPRRFRPSRAITTSLLGTIGLVLALAGIYFFVERPAPSAPQTVVIQRIEPHEQSPAPVPSPNSSPVDTRTEAEATQSETDAAMSEMEAELNQLRTRRNEMMSERPRDQTEIQDINRQITELEAAVRSLRARINERTRPSNESTSHRRRTANQRPTATPPEDVATVPATPPQPPNYNDTPPRSEQNWPYANPNYGNRPLTREELNAIIQRSRRAQEIRRRQMERRRQRGGRAIPPEQPPQP